MKSNKHTTIGIAAKLIQFFNENEIRVWDVRMPSEFVHGHIDGAENVPFDQLEWHLSEALCSEKPIVTCSADDQRSYLVCKELKEKNVEAIDGGDWEVLNKILKNNN